MSLSALIRTFFTDYLRAQRNVSPQTILSYRDALKMLLCFAAERCAKKVSDLTVEEIDPDLVLAFLEHLESERKNSIRTRNIRLAAIRSLFNHIAASDPERIAHCGRILAIPQKRTIQPELCYLEEDQITAFMNAAAGSGPLAVRDRAIVAFLFNTGARVSELTSASVGDVRWQRPFDVRIVGKGRKERYCPLWPETVSLMQAHLDARGNSGDAEPLFMNRRGQRLTRFGVREILKRLHSTAEKTSSSLSRKGSGPHVFRHSAAIHLLRSGVETNVIKAWLGHASIETTARYIQIDIAMKHAALEKCDPMPAGPNGKEWRRTDEIIDWLKRL